MKIAALSSGGKDSNMAIWSSQKEGHQVSHIITMIPKNPESYMFHYPNVEFCSYQAKSMGIPWIGRKTRGEKEKELLDLKKAIHEAEGIEGITAGGLASNYQRNRIRGIAESLGLEVLLPYWKIDPEEYWKLMLSNGFKVMIVGVACEGLDKSWLGQVIDQQAFRELKKLSERHRFNMAGEGGEFETFVLDAPNFKKRLDVTDGEIVWDRESGFYIIKKARLADKE